MLNFEPRLYQETIAHSCILNNTLIVLPTGMGKTKTAILAAKNRLETYPSSKILFLTPTKPLANQIGKEFKDSTSIENIEVFTGEINPIKRKELSEKAQVIISTPQTIENDILKNTIDLEKFSLLIIDEAHRAVKDYSYTWVAKQYNKKSRFPRIIGLTASPGSDLEKIQEVCKNLYIENIESRTEEDPDVKQYIQEIKKEWITVDLPKEYLEIKQFLKQAYEERLILLKNMGSLNTLSPSKTELIGLQGKLQGEIARGSKSFEVFRSISLTAETIKTNHIIELLETQGADQCYEYLNELYKLSERTKTKSTKNLVNDLNIKSSYIKLQSLVGKKIMHPKQEKLKEVLQKEIKLNPSLKTIIFTNFRNSAARLEEELNKTPGISSKLFVGQAKKKGTGLSQKEQIALIKDFENGIYNCLISTSIGEEGLDIPDVDLVIFYEPVPSAIRSIQRKGRTARHSQGKLVILITKNTRDEISHWSSFHKEKRMQRILSQLKDKIKLKKQPTLKDYTSETKTKVIVDNREKGSNISKELKDIGLDIDLQTLPVADFLIANKIAIERKTKRDFLASIIDKRLLSQIKDIRNNFEKPLLVLEGEEDLYSIRNIHPNAIRGILSTIVIDYSVPIISTKNYKETAQLIKTIATREDKNEMKEIGMRLEKKPLTTKELQEYIVESLPGVGPTLAKSLLEHFKSIENIFNAKEEELTKIEKLGDKKAKEILRITKEIYT